jgi:acetyl-CoA carboxylase carboxyltransferase component
LKTSADKIKLNESKEAIDRQHKAGKLTARERLDKLLDPGSFTELDALITHRCNDFDMSEKKAYGDGVVTGYGRIDGRLVFVYSQDFMFMGGSLGEMHAKKMCKILDLAMKVGAPIIGINDSGGARIQEGVDSLAGYGEVFYRNVLASGVVPQIVAIMGPCAGGAVYSPALADFILMTKKSYMFITGPRVIKTVTGEDVSSDKLGGGEVHASLSGVAHFVGESDEEVLSLIKILLSYLPSNNVEESPVVDAADSPSSTELNDIVPSEPDKTYDVRDVIAHVVDVNSFFEIHKNYAQNAVVGLARLNGRSIGIVANQADFLAGCLDINSSDKISRFVSFCDSFNLPLLTLVDVPGYLPGTEQEYGGVIRHGAKIIYAYSEASVPKITLILRKAYGGGYIAMCSKHIGGDVVFAWPFAEIAVMGPEGAIEIMSREKLEKAENREKTIKELVKDYQKKFSNPYTAASRGYVDAVIDVCETRRMVINALEMLLSKREIKPRPPKRHGNIPV